MVPRYLLSVLATALVLVATLMPGSDVPTVGPPHMDLVVHVVLFALWSAALVHDQEALRARPWAVVALAALFGFLVECAQLFASDRSFDLVDVVADVAGAALGAAGASAWYRQRSR